MAAEKHTPELVRLAGDGLFPNSEFPLLCYRSAVREVEKAGAAAVEELFHSNGWSRSWRNGVFPYHHYHSTAHEVLGCYSGWAEVQFGGPSGTTIRLDAGDVVVIPAGVAHKRISSSADFAVVGAYPPGPNWDMNYGTAEERERAIANISAVPPPGKDPVAGDNGPLHAAWKLA